MHSVLVLSFLSPIFMVYVFSQFCYLLLHFLPVFLRSCSPPQPFLPSKPALHQLHWPSQSSHYFSLCRVNPADTDNSLNYYVDLLQFWHCAACTEICLHW